MTSYAIYLVLLASIVVTDGQGSETSNDVEHMGSFYTSGNNISPNATATGSGSNVT
ncbi:unnamed protein product, partial [Cylicocyclus nassatus]